MALKEHFHNLHFVIIALSLTFNVVVICKHVIRLRRSRDSRNTVSYVSTILLLNLALADLVTGAYPLWMRLINLLGEGFGQCLVSVTAAATSVEQSVNMILLITALRLYTTFRPFARVGYKPWLTAVAGSWTLTVAVPLLMLAGSDLVKDYDKTGGPLDRFLCNWSFLAEREFPTYRLTLVLLAYNSIVTVVIIVGYAALVRRVLKMRRSLSNATRSTAGATKLKIRVMVLVMTNVSCWIPIVVIALMSNLANSVSKDVKELFIIFFLPANSFVNPIIYSKVDKFFTMRRCCCSRDAGREDQSHRSSQSATAIQTLTTSTLTFYRENSVSL